MSEIGFLSNAMDPISPFANNNHGAVGPRTNNGFSGSVFGKYQVY
jgi:hypothetical protein